MLILSHHFIGIRFNSMATKQQVLEKIAELLGDINDQFDDLQNDAGTADGLKADLFEATVNYFAANVTVYNKLEKAASGKKQSEEIVFTPATEEVDEGPATSVDGMEMTEEDADTETTGRDDAAVDDGTDDEE